MGWCLLGQHKRCTENPDLKLYWLIIFLHGINMLLLLITTLLIRFHKVIMFIGIVGVRKDNGHWHPTLSEPFQNLIEKSILLAHIHTTYSWLSLCFRDFKRQSMSQMTMDMCHLSLTLFGHFLIHDLSPGFQLELTPESRLRCLVGFVLYIYIYIYIIVLYL